MPDQITHTDAQALQVIRQTLATGEGRAYDHVAAMFRWLLATLFAAHGGALLGLLGAHSPIIPHAAALTCFATGLVLCLLMGVASTLGGIRISTKLNQARALADQMLLDGVDRRAELELSINSIKPSWRSWVPAYFGGASLVCLVAGMVEVAAELNLPVIH